MSATYRHDMPFGAQFADGRVRFRLYAPDATSVAVITTSAEREQRIPLERRGDGWFETVTTDAGAGTEYAFSLDGAARRVPDPASRFQPGGVHAPSMVVDPASFAWPQKWSGLPWAEHVFYELHVGTFTPAGTYAAARTKLPHLVALGITAIELMPLADVPGERNWGYDGVLPFAPSHNYGTPDELKAFIVDAHEHGLAVYLDVVYNHFGPEGNYLHGYASTFYTERRQTPWGAAIDVGGEGRDDVRAFFIENALYWTQEYRFDGLRLDAVHAIYDGPERRFLRELARSIAERSDRTIALVLENDRNEAPLLEAGFRAQWNDDAHHAMHVIVTGEDDGYYRDYADDPVARLGTTLTQGFAYQGDFSAYRGVVRGSPSVTLTLGSFVTFLQNHDQIGNRPCGERITSLAPAPALRAIVAVYLLAPSPPLLFMGEEWGTSSPFLFFCDFEPELARAVTAGRRSEFASFAGFADPAARERIPDPAAPGTFARSTLHWDEIARDSHAAWLDYYTQLLAIRRRELAPRIADVRGTDCSFGKVGTRGLQARFRLDDGSTLALDANLGDGEQDGFAALPGGYVLFATHDPTYPDSIAPPWSVRWTLS
ncbi:MAG: malto-oligosyltrehalose trehalohydrolase [Candidatus Eremiobacteraeota bacterium]|nr:malto-oligosyltrehalose trehalohydrolase [Candidatus Eremiobacteraeota bacterium]